MGLGENRETITSSQTSLPALISNFVGHSKDLLGIKGNRSSVSSNATTASLKTNTELERSQANQNQSSSNPSNHVQSIHARADCNRCNNNCLHQATDEGHHRHDDEAKVAKAEIDNKKSNPGKRRTSFRDPLVTENSQECGAGSGVGGKKPTIWTNVKSAFKGSTSALGNVASQKPKKKVTCAEPVEKVIAGRDSVRKSQNGKKLRISPDSNSSQRLV